MAIISEDEWRVMETDALRDYKQSYKDAVRRIDELEQLNATLAAQVDRMRPVVDAALLLAGTLRLTTDWTPEEAALEYAARTYQQAMTQLAKEDDDGAAWHG